MLSLCWFAFLAFGTQFPLIDGFTRPMNAMRLLHKLQSVQNDVPLSSVSSTKSLPESLQQHSMRIGLPIFKKASSLAVILAVCYHDPSVAQAKETNPDAIDIRRVAQQPVGAPEATKPTIGTNTFIVSCIATLKLVTFLLTHSVLQPSDMLCAYPIIFCYKLSDRLSYNPSP